MEMTFFNLLAPITYWVLILMWSFILFFYLKRLRMEWHQGSLMLLLFIILTIDAFRTLFESFYFGAWYTARVGLLPISIHDFLVRPQMVIIPKLMNVFAAGLIITILFRYWLPREGQEIKHLETMVKMRTRELTETVEKFKIEIIKRKRAEDELRTSEEKNRRLIQRIQAAVVVHGADTRILTSNLQAQQLLGLTEEQMMGKSAIDPNWHFFREDGTAMPVEEYPVNRVLTTGQPLRDVVTGVHRSTTEEDVWVLVSADPVVDEQGEMTQVIVTFVDITERKMIEEQLKASEERLRMTLEATQIGIWDWDVTNDRYYASPIYYTMLGYEPKEGPADRSEWVQWLHPDDKKTVLEQVNKVLSRTCEKCSYEARFRHADGSYKWQWLFGYGAGHDKNGKVTRMLGLRIDIDKRKRMEEELSIYREHLEKLVRERTAELESANKELDAFAYSVSHDLRAPLRHVDGFMELLQKKAGTALDEQSRHYIDAISDAAKKMGLLIDDLLSFSRMGRHAMAFKQVDLGTLVREVIGELEPDAAGRTIDWRIGDLPAVGGDASMLRIVLANLISNALKFTRPRQQAQIEIGSTPNQGSEAVIFVRDNGVGFDMTYVDKLFGVFQRLHRADEFEGSGIGLASVRRIIARHGGRTWAEGKVDQGATFYFSLP